MPSSPLEDHLFLVAPATNAPQHNGIGNGLFGFAPLLTRRMHVCRNNMHEGSCCLKECEVKGLMMGIRCGNREGLQAMNRPI
jgi:hypothetical protein